MSVSILISKLCSKIYGTSNQTVSYQKREIIKGMMGDIREYFNASDILYYEIIKNDNQFEEKYVIGKKIEGNQIHNLILNEIIEKNKLILIKRENGVSCVVFPVFTEYENLNRYIGYYIMYSKEEIAYEIDDEYNFFGKKKDKVSGYNIDRYLVKIISDLTKLVIHKNNEEIWTNLLHEIRKTGKLGFNNNSNVYNQILEKLAPLGLIYSTVMGIGKLSKNRIYFIKQKDFCYDAELLKRKDECNNFILTDTKKHKNNILVKLYQEHWASLDEIEVDDNTDIKKYITPMIINKREWLKENSHLFLNKALNEMEYEYIIFLPIVRKQNSGSKDKLKLNNIVILFYNGKIMESSLFYETKKIIRLSQIISYSIDEAIKISENKLFYEISSLMTIMGENPEEFGVKITKSLSEYFNCEKIAIYLSEDKDSHFTSRFHNIQEKDYDEHYNKALSEYTKIQSEKNKGRLTYIEERESEVFCLIQRRGFPKPTGILHLINKKSSINNKIVPFTLEETELIRYISDTIAVFYESMIYMIKLNNYFKVISHEINTSSRMMKSLISMRLEKRFRSIINDPIYDVTIESLNSQLKIITGVVDNTMLFVHNKMVLNYEEFFVYKDIFFTWRTALSSRFRDEYKELSYDEVLYSKEKMFADKGLIEQLIYNLLTNAIKYSYYGTKIYFDYNLISNEYIIKVVDYGYNLEIENFQKIRQPGIQGKEVGKIGKPGLGMGLYIIDKILDWHGGKLNPICTKISDINIPVVHYLLKSLNKEENEDDISQYKEKYEMLDKEELKNCISNIIDTKVDNFLERNRHNIDLATYKKEFIISIPVGGRK